MIAKDFIYCLQLPKAGAVCLVTWIRQHFGYPSPVSSFPHPKSPQLLFPAVGSQSDRV